ncbi:hypothetical protein M885DRAFT_610693, partial [Pelagophyceae sp. CCMP2097]
GGFAVVVAHVQRRLGGADAQVPEIGHCERRKGPSLGRGAAASRQAAEFLARPIEFRHQGRSIGAEAAHRVEVADAEEPPRAVGGAKGLRDGTNPPRPRPAQRLQAKPALRKLVSPDEARRSPLFASLNKPCPRSN